MNGGIQDYLKGEDGNQYTWSFSAFKDWKRNFLSRYKEETGRNFKEDIPSSGDREAIYKRLFGMDGIDIFQNENINRTLERDVSQEVMNTANYIAQLI